jgi:hypothetical protein
MRVKILAELKKTPLLVLGMIGTAILGGIVLTVDVLFEPAPKIGGDEEPLMDLMLPADELPAGWRSERIEGYYYVRHMEYPEIKRVFHYLRYVPTGGPAVLAMYDDPNRTVFNEKFGWAKDRHSAVQRFSYRDVPLFKYQTWMGYPRYLAHIDGYTFIFDAGIYGTDSYQSSGAPEEDTNELFKAAIMHALSRDLRASEVEMPEPKRENLTIGVVPVETAPLRITYEGRDKRVVPTGYLEWGTLKVRNQGDKDLENIALELVTEKELTPGEIDIIKHTPGKQIEERDIRLIKDVSILPTDISIEDLAPGETREFQIAIGIHGEGNYFSIEAICENSRIWGMHGFVNLSSKDFPYEEFKYLTSAGFGSIIVVYRNGTKDIITPEDGDFETLDSHLLSTISQIDLQARCVSSEGMIDEIRNSSYAVELVLKEPEGMTISQWIGEEDRRHIRTNEEGYRVLVVKHALFGLDGEYGNNIFISSGVGDWSCWAINREKWVDEIEKVLGGGG